MNIIKKIKLRLRYRMLKNSFNNKMELCRRACEICNLNCENCAWMFNEEELKACLWYARGKKWSELDK